MNSNEFDRVTTGLANTTSRRQALKLMAGGILGGAAMTAGIKGATAQRPVGTPKLPVLDSVASDAGSLVSGTLVPTEFFVNEDGALAVAGQLTNVLVDGVAPEVDGETVTSTLFSGLVDMAASTASCEILDLVINPINLDLLGLVISTDTIHLNITAEQGPNNLLGNLLCAVTRLFDGGPTAGLAGLLNNILRALGLA